MRKLAAVLAFVVGCHWGAPPPPENELPSVTASASPTMTKIDLPVLFWVEVSDPDGVIKEVAWDFGDETGATGLQPPLFGVSHAYAGAGSFTVTATAVDDRGGTATDSLVIEVSAVDAPVITVDAVELLGTVDDPAVSTVTVSVDGGPAEDLSVQDMSFAKEVAVPAGTTTAIVVDAEDSYGNPASVTLNVTVP